jgi:hypothetical protein
MTLGREVKAKTWAKVKSRLTGRARWRFEGDTRRVAFVNLLDSYAFCKFEEMDRYCMYLHLPFLYVEQRFNTTRWMLQPALPCPSYVQARHAHQEQQI